MYFFLQGANILLTDNGDVKLGKFLLSVLILRLELVGGL